MKLALLGLSFACCVAYGQATAHSLSFEAASIRPSQFLDGDKGCFGGPGASSPGQYRCSNTTLADILRSAFAVRFFQVVSPQTRAFDITAKAPAGTTKEQCRVMLQNLLIERFKLAYHYEKREIEGYELVLGRNGPKLKEAPPESPQADSAATASSHPAGKLTPDRDGFPVLPPTRGQMFISALPNGAKRLIYDNVTLEPFVALLIGLLRGPVADRTGLKGRYNLTLTFMDPTARGGTAFSASTENGTLPGADVIDAAPSIFTAIEQQLGLKLQRKRLTLDVVVVDHAEKTPTEN